MKKINLTIKMSQISLICTTCNKDIAYLAEAKKRKATLIAVPRK